MKSIHVLNQKRQLLHLILRAFPLCSPTDDVLLRSQAVFSDVQDDFCDVKKILSRFEEWRGSYSDSYHSAYIRLCLPKLLNPIIRHQLLPWNPLKVRVDSPSHAVIYVT